MINSVTVNSFFIFFFQNFVAMLFIRLEAGLDCLVYQKTAGLSKLSFFCYLVLYFPFKYSELNAELALYPPSSIHCRISCQPARALDKREYLMKIEG